MMDDVVPRYRRSPFLVLEWDGDRLVLVHCDSLRRFRVDERLVAIASALADWSSLEDLAGAGHQLGVEEMEQLVRLGVVEEAPGPPPDDRPAGHPLHHWNLFDLAVHRGQNIGGCDEALLRQRAEPPPPAFKARPPGPSTVLPPPAALPQALGEVLERRRSVRRYGRSPLGLGPLSTLLHHSARVAGVVTDDLFGEQVLRPYPTGGARSELEIYVVANDVAGLEPGAHHYDARAHDLVQVRHPEEGQDRLNASVLAATGAEGTPQAVLLITAVFARVMWKYHDIALGLINRDTGCLYQTLYLVATALDLAPCVVGAGPEAAHARWMGLDPLVESVVGCLLVGTLES